MIQELSHLLGGLKALTLRVQKVDPDRLEVLLLGKLDEAPKQSSDEIEQLRAALAAPVVLRGTAQEIDAAIPDLVQRLSQARATVATRIDEAVSALEAAATEAAVKAKAKAEDAKKARQAKQASKDASKAAAKTPVAAARGKPGPKPKLPPAVPVAPAAEASVESRDVPGALAQSLLFDDPGERREPAAVAEAATVAPSDEAGAQEASS